MADDVQVKFGAQIDGLVAGINEAKEQLESITSPIAGISSAFAGLAEAVTAGLAVERISEAMDRYAELGESISRTAAITGVATQQIQLFTLAVKLSGGDAETASMTLNILQKNIGDAISQAGTARTAFENMGFSLDQLKNTDVVDLLFQIKERMDEAGTSAEQSALKQDYLRTVAGRGAASFLALRMSLEEVRKVAAETGVIMDPTMVAQADHLAESSKKLSAAWQGFGQNLSSVVAPAYDAMIAKTTSLIEATNSLLAVFKVPASASSPSQGFFSSLAHLKTNPQNPNKSNGPSGSRGTGKELGEGQFGPTQQASNPLPPLEKKDGPADNSAEKNDIAIEKSDLQTALDLYRLDVAAKKDADDAKVASGQMSKQGELSDLVSLMGQERDMALDEITQERDLYDANSADWEELNNKKLIVAQQYANEIAKLNAQIAQAQAGELKKTEAEYKSFFDTIDKSMDSMLQGVLQGTQTWQQAMGKLFDNIALSFMEDVAKMMLKWAAFEAVQAVAPGSMAARALGSQVPNALGGTQGAASNGQSTLLAAAINKLFAAIGINTAAHTTGTLATTTNTAATAADAVASTTSTVATTAGTVATTANTATTASSALLHAAAMTENTIATAANTIATWVSDATKALPSFDVGSYSVPSDMIAQIHAGEMIIPASQAEQIRSGSAMLGGGSLGGGGGGGAFTVNINAIDTQTGANFLKQNAGVIAQTLAGQMRNGNNSLTSAMRG